MVKSKLSTVKLAHAALLAALAIIMHSVEATLPPLMIGVPVKLGLANVFTLLTIMLFGKGFALSVTILRCLVATLITGAVSSLPYSLVGALLSLTIMLLFEPLRKRGKLTAIGMSVAGAFMFNLGQLTVGCFVIGWAMLYYFPIMSLLSIPTGVITGLTAHLINERFSKKH